MYLNSIHRDQVVNPIWQEEAGRLVVLVQTIPLPGVHSKDSSFKGIWNEWVAESASPCTGDNNYYRWGGPDLAWNPGAGLLSFRFHISNAGQYQLGVLSRETAEEGSCFVRIDGQQWWILPGSGRESWDWARERETSPGQREPFNMLLAEGFHEVVLSGRSHGFLIDRWMLTQNASDFGLNSLPASGVRPR